jgi:hypothetical protein
MSSSPSSLVNAIALGAFIFSIIILNTLPISTENVSKKSKYLLEMSKIIGQTCIEFENKMPLFFPHIKPLYTHFLSLLLSRKSLYTQIVFHPPYL